MSYRMKHIFESGGIVDNNMQWETLCDIIIEYMWDLEDGLANKITNEDIITKLDIEDYLDIINRNDIIIPEWIGDFKINIKDNDYKSNGLFFASSAKLKDNKLYFEIDLRDRSNKELMYETLTHEFRHAYDRYIFLSKNMQFSKQQKTNMRIYGMKFEGVPQDKNIQLIKNFSKDFLEINEDVFQDPTTLAYYISKSLYYADNIEINSFLQQFHASNNKIINNNKNTLINEIKEVRKFRGDFNSIQPENKLKANILQNISVSPYDNQYFRYYKSFQIFADKLKYVDIDIATETLQLIRKQIKLFLDIPIYKTLTNNDSETQEILKKISIKEKKIFDLVIIKMNNIFARSIIQFEENNFQKNK